MSFVKGKEGPFTFDILNPKDSKDLVKSKIKKIAFVVDYSGPENKIAYTLDSRTLSRKVYSGGKSGDEVRADLGGLDKIVRITVEISPTKVIVKNRFGKVLDSVDRAGNNGRFGFEDEVALSYVGH
jgi:hypothetical protein